MSSRLGRNPARLVSPHFLLSTWDRGVRKRFHSLVLLPWVWRGDPRFLGGRLQALLASGGETAANLDTELLALVTCFSFSEDGKLLFSFR